MNSYRSITLIAFLSQHLMLLVLLLAGYSIHDALMWQAVYSLHGTVVRQARSHSASALLQKSW